MIPIYSTTVLYDNETAKYILRNTEHKEIKGLQVKGFCVNDGNLDST